MLMVSNQLHILILLSLIIIFLIILSFYLSLKKWWAESEAKIRRLWLVKSDWNKLVIGWTCLVVFCVCTVFYDSVI